MRIVVLIFCAAIVCLVFAQPALALYAGLSAEYDEFLSGYVIRGVEYNSSSPDCSFGNGLSYTADGANTVLSLENYFSELLNLSLMRNSMVSQLTVPSTQTGVYRPVSLFVSGCLLHPDMASGYGIANVAERDDSGNAVFYYYPVGCLQITSSTPGDGFRTRVCMPLAVAVEHTPEFPVYPVTPVPEPVSSALFCAGGAVLAMRMRARRNG